MVVLQQQEMQLPQLHRLLLWHLLMLLLLGQLSPHLLALLLLLLVAVVALPLAAAAAAAQGQ
jgi:hypothetical protein